MGEENLIKGGLSGIFLLFVGSAISAYMLLHLDREAHRLLDGDKRWYPRKKRGEDAFELKKIKRNIRTLYSVCLVISIVASVFFSFKLAQKVGWF